MREDLPRCKACTGRCENLEYTRAEGKERYHSSGEHRGANQRGREKELEGERIQKPSEPECGKDREEVADEEDAVWAEDVSLALTLFNAGLIIVDREYEDKCVLVLWEASYYFLRAGNVQPLKVPAPRPIKALLRGPGVNLLHCWTSGRGTLAGRPWAFVFTWET